LVHCDEVPSFGLDVEADAKSLSVTHGQAVVTLACSAGRLVTEPDWWMNVAYPRDTYRGQGDREDYFTPGRFEVPLVAGQDNTFTMTAALGDEPAVPQTGAARERALKPVAAKMPGGESCRKALAIAVDDFVADRTVKGQALSTLLAGFPWFADWGRDTFIALPGLLLSSGRVDEAARVLQAFAGAIREGLVPNRFDDYDDDVAHYNTVDGSLWFVHAGLAYLEAPGVDAADQGWLIEAMRCVLDAYAAGTHAQSHSGEPVRVFMDRDGLISAGTEHSQLTWMDAACGDVVFTPRFGKCVEINALWYSGLVGVSAKMTGADPKAAAVYAKLAKKAKTAFSTVFWSDALQRLIDHVSPEGEVDLSMRPNQILAASLERSPLSQPQAKAVVEAVGKALLTPVGLRTLPPDDVNYHPYYGGPQFERDRSYHQGTIWPWLLGPYVEAVLRTGKFSKKARSEARLLVNPLLDYLMGQGLGQLHEIHDADPPHAPRGCTAQAWSVAELVRVLGLMD